MTLTSELLKDYLRGMPSGDVFDLSYAQFADVFPPGEPDAAALDALLHLAAACNCDFENNARESRFELTKRPARL